MGALKYQDCKKQKIGVRGYLAGYPAILQLLVQLDKPPVAWFRGCRKDRSFDWTPLLLHDMGYEVPPPSFKGPKMSGCDVMLVVVGLLLEVGNMENIRKSRETIGRIVCWETLLAMKLFW